jgi:phosphoketolase
MASLLPTVAERVFLVHGHPEVFSGVMRPLDTGGRSRFLGYRNRGGTLDTFGMLYANHCTWAHVLQQVAELLGQSDIPWLSADEKAAAQGVGDPDTLR